MKKITIYRLKRNLLIGSIGDYMAAPLELFKKLGLKPKVKEVAPPEEDGIDTEGAEDTMGEAAKKKPKAEGGGVFPKGTPYKKNPKGPMN